MLAFRESRDQVGIGSPASQLPKQERGSSSPLLKVKILHQEEDRAETLDDLGETISLLVLERGAEWPSWGTGIRMRAENSAVEVQMDSETTEEFERRVFARLAHMEKKGLRLVAAGYACALLAPNSDESNATRRRESRKAISSRILAQLAENSGAELILAGGSWEITGEEGRQRSQLIELWSELSVQVPGRSMSVRFEDPPSESGVFRAAKKVEPPATEASDLAASRPLAKAASRERDELQSSKSGV